MDIDADLAFRADRYWITDDRDHWVADESFPRPHTGDLRSNLGDNRSPWRRDRDRLFYARAFHRLADITQILHSSPALGHLHNRLTHSLKVAQVARAVAERFEDRLFADPDVCDAAGLAHDLGHPPYGHIGEEALDDLLIERGESGYEGNAQAFRVINKIAVHSPIRPGLNFARATLKAILKYPNVREYDSGPRTRGVYPSEKDHFSFADQVGLPGVKSVEAEIVDWADDISYALHDLDDFYRAGFLRFDDFISTDVERLYELLMIRQPSAINSTQWAAAYERLCSILSSPENTPLLREFQEDRLQQGLLRALTSRLISEWLDTIERRGNTIVIDDLVRHEIALLKEFVYQRVIANRTETARGQQRERVRVRRVFEALDLWMESESWERLPSNLRFAVSVGLDDAATTDEFSQARAISDFISQLTESEIVYWERELV